MSQLYWLRWMTQVQSFYLIIRDSRVCLLYYRSANTHLCRLDSLQYRAESICSITFPLLSFCYQAAAIGLICR